MRTLFTAAMIAILSLASTQAQSLNPWDSATAYWTTGIRINQGEPFGIIGVTKKLSARIFQYTGADLGGVERSITTQTAIRITRPAKWELYAALGPQIETIETEPDAQGTIDYITASTGALITYHRNNTLTFTLGFQYLWTNATMKHWKFGLGLLIPIDLSQ